MARGRSRSNGLNNEGNGATLGFEAKLWQAADALRNTWVRPSTSTSYSA